MKASDVRKALAAQASKEKAAGAQRFFKTGPGQYGEGDVFIGVTVPEQRRIAKDARGLALDEITSLLSSTIHEERLTGLIILVDAFKRADDKQKAAIVKAYKAHFRFVNNWDLVDSSAPQILGTWLLDKDRAPLHKLAKSKDLWERRIAIVATQSIIRAGEHEDTFAIARLLMSDQHDLIHKAVGWMLREVEEYVGADTLRAFLKAHAHELPRTALRYAIEHFSPEERAKWLGVKAASGASATRARSKRA